MIRPGPRNLVTDGPGIAAGNAEDARAWTDVTVVLPEAQAGRGAIMAQDGFARAIARGVYEAESLGALPSYRSLHPMAPIGNASTEARRSR